MSGRSGEAVGGVRRGMGVMARKLLDLEEMEKRGKEVRGREREEFEALKVYNKELTELLDVERKGQQELEEEHKRVAGELESSVPLKRLLALQEELKHSKRMHGQVVKKYTGLEASYQEKVQHLREEQEVLLTVREEITRVNSDLSSDDKKRKQEGRARLRTLSQHRERGDGGDGDA